jgi:AcrR family transcriptional regulator
MGNKTQAAGETVQRILAAARDAFAEQGYSGTTVDAIARKAGVNKATLYYHIGDKETLYAEVVRTVLESNIDDLQQNIQEAKAPEEQLRRYIRTMAAAVENNPWLPRIMLRELAAGGASLPDAVLQSFGRLLATLKEILDEGVRRGVFVRRIPFLIHMMVMGALVFCKTSAPLLARAPQLAERALPGREPTAAEIAVQVEALVLKAIRK